MIDYVRLHKHKWGEVSIRPIRKDTEEKSRANTKTGVVTESGVDPDFTGATVII